MTTWEYLSLMHRDTQELNTLGAEGWELVTVCRNYFYFKRPVPREIQVVVNAR
jgi:hypothetical protein